MRRVHCKQGQKHKIKRIGYNFDQETPNETFWVNSQQELVAKINCSIPKKIRGVMKSIDTQYPGLEFSIFAKGDFDKNSNEIVIKNDFFIPKQVVSGATVDYKEDAPEGYNCVIHKHPNGILSFSSIDREFINQNFELSLLWVNGDFHTGQIKTKTVFGYISIELNIIEPVEDLPVIPKEMLDKIKEEEVVVHPYQGNYPYHHSYPDLFKQGYVWKDGRFIKENVEKSPGVEEGVLDKKEEESETDLDDEDFGDWEIDWEEEKGKKGEEEKYEGFR